MKFCNKCQTNKNIIDFYKCKSHKDGLSSICILCEKNYKKQNLKHIRTISKIYKQKNKEKFQIYMNNYRLQNKEKIREQKRIYQNNKRKTDIQYKLKDILWSRINKVIKRNFRKGSAVKDLGCTIDFLKQYLESKFQSGMTWGNYGTWHIDHIIPLSSFNLQNIQEFKLACHYTNLQPLWAKDNIIKKDKLTNNIRSYNAS